MVDDRASSSQAAPSRQTIPDAAREFRDCHPAAELVGGGAPRERGGESTRSRRSSDMERRDRRGSSRDRDSRDRRPNYGRPRDDRDHRDGRRESFRESRDRDSRDRRRSASNPRDSRERDSRDRRASYRDDRSGRHANRPSRELERRSSREHLHSHPKSPRSDVDKKMHSPSSKLPSSPREKSGSPSKKENQLDPEQQNAPDAQNSSGSGDASIQQTTPPVEETKQLSVNETAENGKDSLQPSLSNNDASTANQQEAVDQHVGAGGGFSPLSEISEASDVEDGATDTEQDESAAFLAMGFTINQNNLLNKAECCMDTWLKPIVHSPMSDCSDESDATAELSEPTGRRRRGRSRVPPSPPPVVDLLEEGSDEERKAGQKIMHCGYMQWQGKEYADVEGSTKAKLELKQDFLKLRAGDELLWSKQLKQIRSFRKIADEELPNTYIFEVSHGAPGTPPVPLLFTPQHNIASWFDAIPCGSQVSQHYTWEDFCKQHPEMATKEVHAILEKFQAYTMEDDSEQKVSHLPNVFNNTPTKLTFMNVEITNYDARRFEKAELFNDSCIDFFMKMILYLLQDFQEGGPKCFAFSSLFYSRLKSDVDHRKDLANVCRWSKGADILNQDLLIVPINDNNVHWWLTLVVNPSAAVLKSGNADMRWAEEKTPRIIYMDSLSGVASVGGGGYRKNMGANTDAKSHVAKNLKSYMAEECKSLEGTDFDRDSVDELNAKVPVQENFTDCGIFILEYVIQVLLRPSILTRLGKHQLKDWFAQSLVSHRREQLRACLGYLAEISNHGEQCIDELMKLEEHKDKVKQFLLSKPAKSTEPTDDKETVAAEDVIVTVGLAEVAPSLRLFVKIDRDQQEFDFAPGICVVITEVRKQNNKSFMRNMKFEVGLREIRKLRMILEERAGPNNIAIVARQSDAEMTPEEQSALELIGFDFSAQSLGPRSLIIGSRAIELGKAVVKSPATQMRMMVLRVKWNSEEGIQELKQGKGKSKSKAAAKKAATDGTESQPEESPPNTDGGSTSLKRAQSQTETDDGNASTTKRQRTENETAESPPQDDEKTETEPSEPPSKPPSKSDEASDAEMASPPESSPTASEAVTAPEEAEAKPEE